MDEKNQPQTSHVSFFALFGRFLTGWLSTHQAQPLIIGC